MIITSKESMMLKAAMSVLARRGVSLCAAALVSVVAGSASAQVVASYDAPTGDRWWYPFNFAAGTEGRASLFGAILQSGFDDRDSDLFVTYNTSGQITPGLGRLSYKITGATLKVYIESDATFNYDPTFDSVTSLYASGDPELTVDADLGRPIDVWAVGYRNGLTAASVTEASTFGGVPVVPPAEAARSAFPALVDAAGATTDVSRQVRQRFDAAAMALGRMYDDLGQELTPGALVPAGTEVRFDLAVSDANNIAYLQRCLDAGKVNLMVSSLSPASGGPGGGGGVVYPRVFTKENALGAIYAAKLELEVAVTCEADFTGDGLVDDADFVVFASAYESFADPRGDFNEDGFTDDADFVVFAAAYEAFVCGE